MKALIIDNETHIISGLTTLIDNYCKEIKSIESASGISDGLEKINKFQPDILFLDIELDHGTGLDLLNQISDPQFKVIFITAFNKYALDAFKMSAVDFLLKPIDPDDLILAVEKAKDQLAKEQDQLKLQVLVNNLNKLSQKEHKIIVSDKDNVYAIDIKSILYLEADGPYTKILREDGFIFTSKNLKKFEVMLSDVGFFRIHHSYLANLSHIARFDKHESTLVLNNNNTIPVSVRRRDGLLKALQSLNVKNPDA